MKRLLPLLALTLLLALGLPANAATPRAPTATTYTLPDLLLADVQNAVLPGSIPNGRGFLLGGVGSDLWRSPADPFNEFWMMTDRGPNTQISVGGKNRRTFPVPEFTPLLLRVRAANGALILLQTIPIVGSSGAGVTGLSNLDVKDDTPYDYSAQNVLPFNPSGLDTEGMVRTAQGDFWLAEENRPSLVHVSATGKVLKRFIPAGVTLAGADYPVAATLPALYDKRRANRGFEGLALSADGKTLYAALQSPLANPSRAVGDPSRNTRILAFDIASEQQIAEYVYRFENVDTFDPANVGKPDEMKISGIIAAPDGTLLVEERTDNVAKVYRTSALTATNILSTTWDDATTTPSLEALADPATAGISVLPKTLLINLQDVVGMPPKVEGLALVGPNRLAVANDNDFDIGTTFDANGNNVGTGAKSKLLILDVPLTGALPNRVASGDTAQTSSVLWARATTAGVVTFAYGTNAALTGALSATATVTDTLVPAKVQIGNLTPSTQYYYRATDAAGVSDSGTFRTPAAPGAAYSGLRFGVTGDWRGELAPYPAVANVVGRNLDFFVLHGDTIYSDFPSPSLPLTQALTLEQFRVKHNEVYSTRNLSNTLADVRASTSVFAMIDDHEVTNDFAGGAPPASDARFDKNGAYINETNLFKNGLQAFQEFNPIRDEFYGATGDARTAGKRKLYRARTYGRDAAMFLTDQRSFRDQELPNVTSLSPAAIATFLTQAFDPARTLLGKPQLADLKSDLLNAQKSGVLWKFVLVPEPIQNLGVLAASDRYEGYAAERTELLKFITDNKIHNVVFVSADIHSTLVNNLTYQTTVGGPQIPTDAFEITTGSVAFDAPFGPTVVDLATQLGLVPAAQKAAYDALPTASAKDAFVAQLVNTQLTQLGYDTLGLDGSPIKAKLTQGSYVALHTYGWTEFGIDAKTQQLTITTYGIDYYSEAALAANPNEAKSRTPRVVSAFTVTPNTSATLYLPVVAR